MPPSSPGLKSNLLALAMGCVASLLLAELVLRIHNPIPIPVRGKRLVLPRNGRFVRKPLYDSPKFDREIVVTTNELGFRGPALPAEGEARIRVFAVGGSTTECAYNSDESAWPKLLADRLQARFPTVWLNNAGLDGNSTFGHRLLLEQIILDLDPDYVLFLVGINDVARAEQSSFDSDTKRALRDMLIERSEVLSTAQAFWRSYRARSLGLRHSTSFDLAHERRVELGPELLEALLEEHRRLYVPGYEARLQGLVELTKRGGAEPVLLTQPGLYGDYTDPATGLEMGSIRVDGEWTREGVDESSKARWLILELYNEATRRVGRDSGVQVIDLAAKLPKDSALFYDWMHYSKQGSPVVANIVAEALLPLLEGRQPR